MNIEPETNKKIQELQILEQNLQNLIMQKQSVQIELNESLNALEELKISDDEVYKVLGGIMIKADKNSPQYTEFVRMLMSDASTRETLEELVLETGKDLDTVLIKFASIFAIKGMSTLRSICSSVRRS